MRKLMKFQPFDSLPWISLPGLPNAKDLGASTTFAREKDVEKNIEFFRWGINDAASIWKCTLGGA